MSFFPILSPPSHAILMMMPRRVDQFKMKGKKNGRQRWLTSLKSEIETALSTSRSLISRHTVKQFQEPT